MKFEYEYFLEKSIKNRYYFVWEREGLGVTLICHINIRKIIEKSPN